MGREMLKNMPEQTVSELEGENFTQYVVDILAKRGEHALVELIERGKINLELEKIKAVETGNMAERANPDFDVVDHMTKRADIFVNALLENKEK